LFVSVLVFLAVIPALSQTKEAAPAPTAISPTTAALEGKVQSDQKSVCDLEKPRRTPDAITLLAGTRRTLLSGGCKDWDSKEVVGLVLKVTNATGERTVFKVLLPAEITITTEGGARPAAALFFPWGRTQGYSMFEAGGLTVELAPRESAEFLYLLPKTALPPAVEVQGYGSLPLAKGK
jgi:hypothetical protein